MDQRFLLDQAQNVVNEAETLKIQNACLRQELENKDRLIEALRSQNATLAENQAKAITTPGLYSAAYVQALKEKLT